MADGTAIVSCRALAVSVQAVRREMLSLEKELTEMAPSDPDMPNLQELHLSWSKAESELEDAYKDATTGIMNFPPYDDLVKGITGR